MCIHFLWHPLLIHIHTHKPLHPNTSSWWGRRKGGKAGAEAHPPLTVYSSLPLGESSQLSFYLESVLIPKLAHQKIFQSRCSVAFHLHTYGSHPQWRSAPFWQEVQCGSQLPPHAASGQSSCPSTSGNAFGQHSLRFPKSNKIISWFLPQFVFKNNKKAIKYRRKPRVVLWWSVVVFFLVWHEDPHHRCFWDFLSAINKSIEAEIFNFLSIWQRKVCLEKDKF